jgi:carboxyl-terminal processing protease
MLSKFSKRLIIIASLFVVTVLLGIVIGQTREKNDVLKGIDLFGETLYYVKNRYVEVVNDDKIFNGALHGLAENLDPESFFLEPAEYEMYLKSGGKFPQDNIGIGIIKVARFLRVISVEPGSPAAKAGIETGDLLSHIEGRAGYDLSIYKVYMLLSGKSGTKISIVINKGDTGQDKKLDLIRNNFPLTQPIHDTFSGGIHYISLRHFYPEDINELKNIIKIINGQPLIIDLRQNYYGSREGLIEALDMFIGEGDLFKEEKSKNTVIDYKSKPDKILISPLPCVIVDKSTCHFAEVFSAVLAEKKLIQLYGRQTMGLIGLQTAIPIYNKGAIYLTTEIFLTPEGNNFYLKGIQPEIEIKVESESAQKSISVKSDNGLIERKDPMLAKVLELAAQKPK